MKAKKKKAPLPVRVIKASAEELRKPEIWPDESLPKRGRITKQVVQEQVGAAYPGVSARSRHQIVESLWSRFEFDTPYARYYNFEKLGTPGKFTILREWTWPERFDVLERCHQAWERNPLARAGVEWTNHFVIGNGGQITYYAKEVEDVLEEFREDPVNDILGAEREFCTGLQVDGEVILRFYHNRQGRTQIIPIRPWHIHWINTADGNYKRAVSYHYVYTIYRSAPGQSDFGTEDVPADDLLLVANNKYAYELRGRPDLFSILPWLKAYRDWLEERARINRRKTIYYVLTVKNATPEQMDEIESKYSVPPPPGSILVVNENVKLESVESHISAEQALEDGRQIKLMAIAGMLLPEFYFADGANSTLASATAQSLPALRKFDDYQDILERRVWIPVYRKVIRNAIEAGRIRPEVEEIDEAGKPTGRRIPAERAFAYEYPEIKEKDPKTLAEALQIAVENRWASNRTASVKMGFNPNKEAILIRLQDEEANTTGEPNPPPPPTEEKAPPRSKPSLVSPDHPQTNLGDRTLMPSPAAPSYPGNNPPSGGAGEA